MIVFELVAGVFYPRFAAATGLVYILGRALYARGYQKSGSEGRLHGVLLLDLALVTLFGTSVYGCVQTLMSI